MISLLLFCTRLCLNDFNSVAINSGYLKLFLPQLVETSTTICSVELPKSDCLICMTAEIIAEWILRFASVFSGINLTNLIKLTLIIIWYSGSNCDFPRKKKKRLRRTACCNHIYGTRYVRFVLMITRCLRSSPCFDELVRRPYVSSSATTSIQLLKISISLFLTHFQSFRQSTTLPGSLLVRCDRTRQTRARERGTQYAFSFFFLNYNSNNCTCFFMLLTVMVTFTHHLYICALLKYLFAIVLYEEESARLCVTEKKNIYKKSRF